MTKLTMRNTKAELFAAIQELQAQLASVNAELEKHQAPSGQAPARPVTDRSEILATMREFAITNNCPTRLRDGAAQYYSYRVNAWLDI